MFSDTSRLLSLLHAVAVPPPLLSERFLDEIGDGYYQRVGDGAILLVVENSTTCWSIRQTLPPQHAIGYLAWGLGNTFTSSIKSISDRHGIREIRYFGDLDLSGVRIPKYASHIADDRSLRC